MSVSSKSLQFWRKFTDEQTRHLVSLTKDLIDNNAIKKEVVWERVASDQKALELGLITGKEDEGESKELSSTSRIKYIRRQGKND